MVSLLPVFILSVTKNNSAELLMMCTNTKVQITLGGFNLIKGFHRGESQCPPPPIKFFSERIRTPCSRKFSLTTLPPPLQATLAHNNSIPNIKNTQLPASSSNLSIFTWHYHKKYNASPSQSQSKCSLTQI